MRLETDECMPAGIAAPVRPLPPRPDRVPVLHKLAYGFGGLTDYFFLNIPLAMAQWIYVIALGMSPAMLGIALAVPKIVGACFDPFMGPVSDNTRSRWGRRRPYILAGGVTGAMLLPLMWTPPHGSHGIMFAYALGMISTFSVLYSVFTIPYNALGYELTTDYDERTRVLAWRNSIQLAGVLTVAWAYWICLRPVFGNEVNGVRWLSAGVALVMLVGAVSTCYLLREKTEYRSQPTIPPVQALRISLANRPFMILQLSLLVVSFGQGVTSIMGGYVHLYYICRGDKDLASRIGAWGGTLATFVQFFGLPLGLWISSRLSKREGALTGLAIVTFGVAILPWVLTPSYPWFVILSWLICTLGTQCYSLMFGSMTADICDEDEVATGLRREGAYCAAASLLGRFRDIVMLLVAGWLPFAAGYVTSGDRPTDAQLFAMKCILIAVQLVTSLVALGLAWYYPITRERSAATRAVLDQRRMECASETVGT